MHEYEVKYTDAAGKKRTENWRGETGEDACWRLADTKPGCTALAFRAATHGVFAADVDKIID